MPYPGWDFFNSEHFSAKEVFLFPSSKVVNPKVIYIPAERNFVSVVPNLQKYAENDDNLMDFLLSWQEARKKYPTSHKLALLNLGMDFYSQDGVSNMVSLPQGGVIALEAASSGLQSIVPLLTLIDWLAKGIYQENKPYSYEEIEKIRHLLDEVGKDLSLSDNDSLKERLAGIVSVWQISDGSLIDIKDGRTNTIGKHYFNDVMNDILDDYYLMVPYLKIAKS